MKNCNQCGKCCINYSDGGLSATQREIEHWQQARPDIFEYVKDGLIWIEPDTGKQLSRCPWLMEQHSLLSNRMKYSCSIYNDRPADCRHYPVTIAQMQADECEMLEAADISRPKAAQRRLDKMMFESRQWIEIEED